MTETGGRGSEGREMFGATEHEAVDRSEAVMGGGPEGLPEVGC